MPRIYDQSIYEQVKKVPWRINLVWVYLSTNQTGNYKEVALTNHYHDIRIKSSDLEPQITAQNLSYDGTQNIEDYPFQARGDADFLFGATSGLLSITKITDDVDAKDSPLVIQLDGILKEYTSLVLSENIKGSPVTLYRGFYNENTGKLYSGNGIKRWAGIVDAVNIRDNTDINTSDPDTMSVALDCRNIISVLKDRQAGVYTNENSWKEHYPTDTSMKDVSSLMDRDFYFGKE